MQSCSAGTSGYVEDIMGYRSDVCIALTDSASRLVKTIISHLPEGHEALELVKHDSGTFIDITPKDITNPDFDCDSKMYFEHVKWYERYDDVSFIEEVIHSLDEEDYLVTRVGEDQNDIEQTGSYWDSDVYVSRKIEW